MLRIRIIPKNKKDKKLAKILQKIDNQLLKRMTTTITDNKHNKEKKMDISVENTRSFL